MNYPIKQEPFAGKIGGRFDTRIWFPAIMRTAAAGKYNHMKS